MSSTTQNEVAKALTSAIQTIAESNAQSKEATLTIEAEIVDVIDEGLGTYIVNYLGNKFEASTSHNEITYSVGDRVYVIVPNGNFDKNKIILSPVVPGTSTYASTDTKNTYITLGDNIFESVPDVSLCTYKPHDATKVEGVSTHGFAALFKSALTDSRTFNFTCKIQTNIEKSRRSRGNYGLALYIPVIRTVDDIESKEFYTVIADTNNIIGDPYNLAVPALQNFYFTLPNDMEYYDTDEPQYQPHICSFVRNFLGEDSTKPDDIFITDIQLLSTFEIANSQMEGYYSIITASGGNSFLANVTGDKKTLSVTAYLNGKITRIDRFECYWFKENASITNTSEKFQRFGGLGWEILNEVSKQDTSDDGTISVQYVTNVYTQEVSQTEIHYDTKFKCVLVKDNTIINAITTIKNLGNDAKINLISLSGSNVFAENVGNVDLQLSYYEQGITDIEIPKGFNIGYAWQRLDKNGQFIDNDFLTIDEYKRENNTYYLTGHYPVDLINESNTIACTVYIDRLVEEDAGSVAHRQIIGTVRLAVSTIEVASGGRVVVVNGDKLYKYDADGDSPLVADYDGPLSSRIKAIDPLSLNIYKEDGSELTEHEYQVLTVEWMIPTDSMITPNETYDTEKNPGYMTVIHQHRRKDQYSLSYKIAPRYNKNRQNNNIIVRVTAPSSVFKEPLSAIANIRFLKDGESGTNGSKYSAIITYNGYGYGEKDVNGKVHKLQLIWAKDNWYFYDSANPIQSSNVNLSVSLYADGDPVSSFSGATWKIFDAGRSYDDIVSPVEIPDPRVGHLTHISTPWSLDSRYPQYNKNYCATIEVSVPAVREGSDGQASVTGKTEYVYAYYPIECTYSPYSFNQSDLPRLEGGFSKVLYAADGTNPQYDNSENFYAINSIYNYDDGEDIYDYEWNVSSNLKAQTTDQSTCKITPKSKFDNGVSKNFVKTKLTRSRVVNEKIATKIATLRNEVSQEGKRKNYYTSLQNLLAIFKNFGYNNYIQRLTRASEFYLEKTKLAQTVVEMQKQAIQVMLAARRYMNVNLNEETTVTVSVVQGTVSTLDSNVYKLYLEMWGNEQGHPGKISDLSKLVHLTSKLGTDDESIEDILATAPSSLLIENKIPLREGIPARSCYFTLNSMIDDYNALVNSVYTNYFNKLSNPEMTYYNGEVKRIINDLTIYVDNIEALALLDVDGYHEERYKYQPLVEVLRARLYTASKLEASSYSLMIDNVINLIKDDISKYVTFTEQGGYTNTILGINNTITRLNAEIAMMEDMQTPSSSTFVIHIKPIIMTYNRYGMSNINGWDGNKVEVDGGYILSPQVGAGKKEDDNSFTGVIIGVQQVSEKRTDDNKIGLFGYSRGKQSIFLNADTGSATFGLSGEGQIIIDPSDGRALIKSGNYVLGSSGMQIDLSTPEIRFGSGNFVVDKYGHITAKGGGSVAGWNITDTYLTKEGLYLDAGTPRTVGSTTVTSYGLYSDSHYFVSSVNKGFCLSRDGLSIGNTIRISANDGGAVEVGRLGGESTKHWTISGNLTESYIGYNASSFDCTGLDGDNPNIGGNPNSVYIGTDGIRLGNKFAVDRAGNMGATHLIIKGGTVGGWAINDTSLSANGIEIRSDGRIKAGDYSQGSGWEINKDGNAYFTKGTIGGWSITPTTISSNGVTLNSEGSISTSYVAINGSGVTGPGFSLGASGLNLTSGNISFGGVTLNTNFTMDASLTYIGNQQIGPYISKLTVDTLKVTDLNADRIKAGTLSVDRLNLEQLGSSLSSYVVKCTTLQCNAFRLSGTEYGVVRISLSNGHVYDVVGNLIV